MVRIDLITADRVRQVLVTARTRGVDPVTALDLAGLLRHDALRHDDHLRLLDTMISGVRQSNADELIEGPFRAVTTKLDMKLFLIDFLEKFMEGYRRHGTEKFGRTAKS